MGRDRDRCAVSATLSAVPVTRGRHRADDLRIRGVPRNMLAVWGALFFNVLAFSANPTVVPIPRPVGQLLTQGALMLAVLLALMVNPRVVVRSNLILVLLTMLGVVALMSSIHNEFVLGSTFRACRLVGFVLVLWLLTPWWGRQDMLLLRCHRRCLWIILGTVVAGAAIAPGLAFAFEGRLSGRALADPAHPGRPLRGRAARYVGGAVDVSGDHRPAHARLAGAGRRRSWSAPTRERR